VVPQDFRSRVDDVHAEALAGYDELGSRYDTGVYTEKREALVAALWQRAQRVFAPHVARLGAQTVSAVQREVRGVKFLAPERATELVRSHFEAFCKKAEGALAAGACPQQSR
jgi:hypothetical protein